MKYSTTLINSYNDNQKMLRRSVESCLSQDKVKVQIILSTVRGDLAIDTVRKISKDIDIVINDKPSIYKQINNALPLVKYDWFSFFSGNDIALKNKMRDEIDLCRGKKKVCYSSYLKCRNGSDVKKAKFTGYCDYNYKKHLKGNFVSDVAVMHKSILDKYSPFREKFDKFAFYDLWLRICEGEGESVFVYNSKPTWLYLIDKNSLHQSRRRDEKRKLKFKLYRKFMLSHHDGSKKVFDTFKKFKENC